MESDLFWLCATTQLLVSLRFAALVRQLDKARVTRQIIKLAIGQRQDCWLASAAIWGMILCKGVSCSTSLFIAGSVLLVWLVVRACRRINLMVAKQHE